MVSIQICAELLAVGGATEEYVDTAVTAAKKEIAQQINWRENVDFATLDSSELTDVASGTRVCIQDTSNLNGGEAVGDFEGQLGQIVTRIEGEADWVSDTNELGAFFEEGWTVFNKDENVTYRYQNGNWTVSANFGLYDTSDVVDLKINAATVDIRSILMSQPLTARFWILVFRELPLLQSSMTNQLI